MSERTYEQKLAQEAAIWGEDAQQQAQQTPPDWHVLRRLRHNVIMHAADIDAFLNLITPGMMTLELGCNAGWLTLAMAQRGAHATGIDISASAVDIGRAYYESIRDQVVGSVTYRVADLNTLELPDATYDVIAVKGTLHHLVELERVVDQLERALKPGGLLWISDSHGEERLTTVLAAAACTFILPTTVSYREKMRGLRRFGLRAPSRVKASIEAEGLSPFEGAGREQDWVQLVTRQFTIEQRVDAPAFTGYVTAQLRLPDWLALPFLRLLRMLDLALVKLKLLHNTGLIIYARKLHAERN